MCTLLTSLVLGSTSRINFQIRKGNSCTNLTQLNSTGKRGKLCFGNTKIQSKHTKYFIYYRFFLDSHLYSDGNGNKAFVQYFLRETWFSHIVHFKGQLIKI